MELVRLLRDSKENQRSCWPVFQFLFELADVCGRVGREVCRIRPGSHLRHNDITERSRKPNNTLC